MSTKNHEEQEPELSWFQETKLNLSWTFEPCIKWAKVLFTFRNAEQRQTWKEEMAEAEDTEPTRLTKETRLGTPQLIMGMWDDFMQVDPDTHKPLENPDAEPFNLHDLFKSDLSVREYIRDMFSGWTLGWEARFCAKKEEGK